MKTKTTTRWRISLISLAVPVFGILIGYTRHSGLYWLEAIEILIFLFLLLWAILGLLNDHAKYKEQKTEWERVGEKIKVYDSMLDRGYFAGLTSDNLRTWLDWVTQHQDIEAARAFKDILTKVVNARDDADLPKSTREDARFMLDQLDGISRS